MQAIKSKTNFDAKHKEHNNNASFATTALAYDADGAYFICSGYVD